MENGREAFEVLLKNCINISKLFKFKKARSQESHEAICVNLVVQFLTDFAFEIKEKLSNEKLSQAIALTNDFLEILNSKFRVRHKMTNEEFVNFILYFTSEFEVYDCLVKSIAEESKKIFNFQMKNLLADEENEQVISLENNLMKNFNTFLVTIRNLKKQINSFINLSYKLNEIKKKQNQPLSSMKIEEFILFHEKFANESKDIILKKQSFIEDKISDCRKIFKLFEESFTIFNQVDWNKMTIENINFKYISDNKNIQIQKIKDLFFLKVKEIVLNDGSDPVQEWVNILEGKLSDNLAILKKEYSNIFADHEMTNTLSELSLNLQTYLATNCLRAEVIIEEQFGNNCLKEINEIHNFLAKLESEKEFSFENYLIGKNFENLNAVYVNLISKLKEVNDEIVHKINEKYLVSNYNFN